jgi:hypothetical protein
MGNRNKDTRSERAPDMTVVADEHAESTNVLVAKISFQIKILSHFQDLFQLAC